MSVVRGTRIGPNCLITAASRIELGEHVLFGPNVYVSDRAHGYEDINRPISHQGIVSGGAIKIESGAWLGADAIVYASDRPLTIGRNSVVAGIFFVRRSVEPYTVVSENAARPVRRYSQDQRMWVSVTND